MVAESPANAGEPPTEAVSSDPRENAAPIPRPPRTWEWMCGNMCGETALPCATHRSRMPRRRSIKLAVSQLFSSESVVIA